MDITQIGDRTKLVRLIESEDNKVRKKESLKQSEVFNDRLYQYVVEELERHFSPETVQEMPIVSFINFPRRIVKSQSSIYKDEPTREFFDVSDRQKEVLGMVYDDMEVDSRMRKANEFYTLQEQTHVMIIPSNGKLCMRNLMQHQVDAIPNFKDPEIADAYIISSFDKELYLDYERQRAATGVSGRSMSGGTGTDGVNTEIADKEDYKKAAMRFTYWDKQYNFIFNGHGLILDPKTLKPYQSEIDITEIESPIPGILPIVDIANNKDFEYFVRSGNTLIDFGVQYNSAFSDVWHISRMQGYSVGVLKGPDEMMPDKMKLGPNYLLRLKTSNREGSTVRSDEVDFSFVSPSPDIQSSLNLLETMLTNFISSRGVDPKEVAQQGGASFNSALERLLAMIERFEASKDDIKLFRTKEMQIFEVVKAWLNAETGELDPKYSIPTLPESASMSIQFSKPEMVMTKKEKLDYWVARVENGTASIIDLLMNVEGLERDQAIELKERINGENNSYEELTIPGV